MKKFVYAGVVIVTLLSAGGYFALGGAIGRLEVPGPAHRFQETVGVAYPSRLPNESFTVDIGKLLPYMREADWSSDRWDIWKDPFVVELRNGQKLTIDRFSGGYEIEGVPGLFSNTSLSLTERQKYFSLLHEVLR